MSCLYIRSYIKFETAFKTYAKSVVWSQTTYMDKILSEYCQYAQY